MTVWFRSTGFTWTIFITQFTELKEEIRIILLYKIIVNVTIYNYNKLFRKVCLLANIRQFIQGNTGYKKLSIPHSMGSYYKLNILILTNYRPLQICKKTKAMDLNKQLICNTQTFSLRS